MFCDVYVDTKHSRIEYLKLIEEGARKFKNLVHFNVLILSIFVSNMKS